MTAPSLVSRRRSWLQAVADLLNELGQGLFVSYLILLLAEQLETGFVTDYLNPTPFLIFAAVSITASRFLQRTQPIGDQKRRGLFRMMIESSMIAGVGGIIILHLTARIGPLRWAMAAFLAILLMILVTSLQQHRRADDPN